MESNKSKGVEFRNELQNRVESLLYDTLNQDFRNRKDVCKALQDIADEALAHPQQSEGVEQRTADKLLTETEIFIQRERKICWEAEYQNDEYCVGENALRAFIKRISREYPTSLPQPSEPAALKEFYCIGDKDNLFQCEEQCEDCKKGAALKDGEVLTVGLFYDKRNLRWTTAEATKCDESGKPTSWAVRNGGFCMSRSSGEFEWEPQPSSRSDEWLADHRFDTLEAALKEFTSLLTNHKS